MRARALIAAVAAIGVSALAAGCGQLPAPGATAAGGRPAKVGCVTPKLDSSKTFTITDKNNGEAFCVVAGDHFFVFLHGSLASKWGPIHPSSAAVSPLPSGVMSLAVGVTGGYFEAKRTGTVLMTSIKMPCVKPGLGPEPAGSVKCLTGGHFKVTLLIRGRM